MVNIVVADDLAAQEANALSTMVMMTTSDENISALLALCEENPLVTGGFPSQRPVTRSFDVSFDLRLNKRLSKQSRLRRFETPSHSLWLWLTKFVRNITHYQKG